MQAPFFFEEDLPAAEIFLLNEDTSKHIVQVLRMHENEIIHVTNGKGQVLVTKIRKANKKNTEVQIIDRSVSSKLTSKVVIAISLIKNTHRFEWFLEKATEVGVAEIIPIICERTEKQHFRHDRMKNIIVSAMLQSQQAWLPVLHEPIKFDIVIKNSLHQNRYIAHCIDNKKQQLNKDINIKGDQLILIGPEGDFTKQEIDNAIENNFMPVSLGATRLRTETAGLVAAVLLLNKF